jgi:hypothetical protein
VLRGVRMNRPASTGALLRLSVTNGSSREDTAAVTRKGEVEVVIDPIFDDLPRSRSPNSFDSDISKDGDLLLYPPSSPSQYTFTWRGFKSRVTSETKYSSATLLIISCLLFLFYYLNRSNTSVHPGVSNFFNLFAIHYTIGVLFGFCFSMVYFCFRQRPAPEASFIMGALLWSHYPDILGYLYGFPHAPWMSIFFFHPVVEGLFEYLWVGVLVLDIAIAFCYVRVIEESRPKTSTRNLVAML